MVGGAASKGEVRILFLFFLLQCPNLVFGVFLGAFLHDFRMTPLPDQTMLLKVEIC